MYLGEIKIEALALTYPDATPRYDNSTPEEVERAVYEMKADHNFSGLLEAAVGSINRAFALVEARRLTCQSCADVLLSECRRTKDGRVEIPLPSECLLPEKLYCHRGTATYECELNLVNGKLYTDRVCQLYTVVYRRKIPRIKNVTPDGEEIDLDEGVLRAIPYFVMSELLGREDPERAKAARAEFEKALKERTIMEAPCHQCFNIVYSSEW